MKKIIVKTLSAFLALVLLLSVLPAAVFAAEAETNAHVHSFSNSTRTEYIYCSSACHVRRVHYIKTCACGYTRETPIDYEESAHMKMGEGKYAGSYLDGNGDTRELYSYDCKLCHHVFYESR